MILIFIFIVGFICTKFIESKTKRIKSVLKANIIGLIPIILTFVGFISFHCYLTHNLDNLESESITIYNEAIYADKLSDNLMEKIEVHNQKCENFYEKYQKSLMFDFFVVLCPPATNYKL